MHDAEGDGSVHGPGYAAHEWRPLGAAESTPPWSPFPAMFWEIDAREQRENVRTYV